MRGQTLDVCAYRAELERRMSETPTTMIPANADLSFEALAKEERQTMNALLYL
jgi:hypothetical protein